MRLDEGARGRQDLRRHPRGRDGAFPRRPARTARSLDLARHRQGLGKTIEAIANCLINPSADPEEKTTLLVAPLALLNQWEAELTEKVERGHLSILKYHGPERKKYTAKKLRKFDWVLTTYSTLVGDVRANDPPRCRSFADLDAGSYLQFLRDSLLLQFADEENLEKKAKRAAKKADDPEAWEDFLAPHEDGPLFKMGFYRYAPLSPSSPRVLTDILCSVILDEARASGMAKVASVD